MTVIETKMEEISAIKKKITVSLSAERVKAALEKEYEKISKSAKVKGFRQGKVPRNVLEKFYVQEAVAGAMERLVRESYPEAVEKEMANPISAPFVEPGKFDKDSPFEYSATFEVRPVVQLKDYKGMSLKKFEVLVSKDEVDKQLEVIRQNMSQLEPVSGEEEAKKGLVVIIDFKGKIDGKPFKGSDAKDFFVELGANNILPQLEDNLMGMKKGDKKDFSIKYPEEYFNKELAGRESQFHVHLKDIKKKVLPELTDEFAKDLGNYATLKDVKADIEKRILEAKEREAQRLLSNQVIEQLAETHPFDVPEAMVHSELKSMFENFVRYLSSQNMKFEETGMTIENFIERYKKDAENRVRSFLIVDAIADAEKIVATEEDLEAKLKVISEQGGQPVPKIRQQYEKNDLLGGLRVQIQHEKAVDFIIDKAKIKVEKPKKSK